MRGISQLLVDHNGTQNIDFCTDTEAVFESKVQFPDHQMTKPDDGRGLICTD